MADFGIARAATDAGATTSGAILGSAQYASPEQVSGEPVSARSDIYSLGIVLYEALTGVRPFDGPSPAAVALERLRVDPRPPRELRPDLPASLEATVMRALERDPADRQPSAAELGGELERFRAAELGGIRRRGIGARAIRMAGTAALARAAMDQSDDGWSADETVLHPLPMTLDDTDETDGRGVVKVAGTSARGGAAGRAATRPRRRRRALAPLALAAGLGLAALSVAVLAATASLLDSGLSGGVLGETSPPRASGPAVAIVTASPTTSPSPSPTLSPSPSPSPSPTPEPTPEPTAAPTPRPTARPTSRPTPTPRRRGGPRPGRDRPSLLRPRGAQ